MEEGGTLWVKGAEVQVEEGVEREGLEGGVFKEEARMEAGVTEVDQLWETRGDCDAWRGFEYFVGSSESMLTNIGWTVIGELIN